MPVTFEQLLQDYQHVVFGPFVQQYVYDVPHNQRPYEWGPSNWADLWEDVIETIQEGEAMATDPFYAYHFFGPMFFMKQSQAGDLKILDGQQRLATVEIVLTVMSDLARYYQSSGHPLTTAVELPGKVSNFVQASGHVPPRPRLKLGEQNQSFFDRVVLPIQFTSDQPSPFVKPNTLRTESRENASNASILRCYRFFQLEIAKYLAKQYGIKIPRGRPDQEFITQIMTRDTRNCEQLMMKVYETLTERFYILKAVVPTQEVMYRMFETLNQRGEKLVVLDLFKNLLFDRFERRITEERVLSIWGQLADAGGDYLDDFLRQYWISKYRFVRVSSLFRDIRGKIVDFGTNEQFFEFMREMVEEAKMYKALREPTEERWPTRRDLIQLLEEVQYLGFKQGYPLLLAAYSHCGNAEIDRFMELLKSYLNLVVRSYTILGNNPNEFEEDFSEWALDIRRGRPVEEIVAEIKERTPSTEDVKAEMEGMTGVSPRAGHYIITKINDAMQNRLNRAWRNKPTIEHVIPQSLDEGWTQYLDARGLRPKARNLVDRLGNLTILSAEDNEELGTLPYNEKRERYLATGAPINTRTFDGSDFDEFTDDTIKRREEIMADLVEEYNLWT